MGMAAPQGGVVTSGAAAIGQAGSVTRIDQSTQRATINWQGFGIGAGETVNFVQPNASAITLNRVVGNERSVIDGVLNANGKVFLINSNGVLFNRGSSVNTAGLVASTLDISDADFNAGRYAFHGNGGGSVINMGTLTSASGGYVALLGPSVSNQGVIVATKGTVALGSGNRISLNFNGDSLVNVSIDEGTWAALVENKGAIQADGGTVILTANAANLLLGSQVNNTGIVQARTVDDLKGRIVMRADDGMVRVGGTLDASAPVNGGGGGGGGTVETSGRIVKVSDDATITTRSANGSTGTWTLASDSFTVGAGANISGAQLGAQLGNTNVAIASTGASGADGHIHVNQAVNWSADTALTLSAANDVRINAPITATGMRAGLNLNFGGDYRIDTTQGASVTLSGANASLAMNGQAYTLIHSMSDLEAIDDTGGVAAGRYALAGNLDASGKTYSNTVVSKLSGTLAGLGHTISNLTILEPVHNDYVQTPTGLIGTVQVGSAIRDIGLVGVDVSGYGRVGGLVGENFGGSISQAFVTGTVQGVVNVGGMVGYNGSTFDPVTFEPISGNGIISDSYSSATVTGSSRYTGAFGSFSYIGGLVGRNQGGTYKILRSSASGNVSVFSDPNSGMQNGNIGGLVGGNINGTIADSHATGNVSVSDNSSSVGGLTGLNNGPDAVVTNSYATGSVTGGQGNVGGLVGSNMSGRIVDSYATGNVTGGPVVLAGAESYGGLVGFNSGGSISGSHATGAVTTSSGIAGGLVGNSGGNGASITDSYATGDVRGGVGSGVGGLVGSNSGTISGSHASGSASGETAGGLVGGNQGTITDSYASGNVTGSYAAGGLVGQMDGGTISNSRASGNVTGGTDFDFTGGLVGRMQGGDIDNSHATGTVTGGSGTAELVGSNTGTGSITNSTYRDAAAEAAAEAAAQAAAEAAARAAAAQAAAEAATTAAAQASAQAAAQASADAQAAAIAAAQAAAQATALQARADAGARLAAVATADAQRQTERPAAQMTAGLTQRAALLADNIVFADKRNFSANIQRIEIDGKVFELEDEDSKAPAAQPSTPR